MKRNFVTSLFAAATLLFASAGWADTYVIDTKGAHAFIEFKIKHLGYSWLLGRFNTFEGQFEYDENDPAAARVVVTIDTDSVDSNHAERDKHLRSGDFLDTARYPQAKFVSTQFEELGNGKAILKGDFTLHGVTRPITIDVMHIGAGKDPWGGYRRGFQGITRIALKDYGILTDLGPASQEVELFLTLEGIRS